MQADRLEQIRTELRRARATDRIHGAYLFCGEPGTGKRDLARWFASLLLCTSGDADPCEACRACRMLASEESQPGHPDLHILQPDGAFLRVEQIRDMQRALSLVSNERGHRVVLLFEADRLRTEAANALLKTLEEPPGATTLVLVAERARALPATLRSRATLVRFAPQGGARLAELLEESGLPADEAWLAAEIGGGSPSAAQDWADEHLESALEMHRQLEGVGDRAVSELLDFAETFRGSMEHTRPRTELFLSVHDALARRAMHTAAENADEAALERWLDRLEAAAEARRELRRRNLNPQIVVENLLLDLRSAASKAPARH